MLLLLLANFDFLLTEVVEEEDRDLPLQKFENILKTYSHNDIIIKVEIKNSVLT